MKSYLVPFLERNVRISRSLLSMESGPLFPLDEMAPKTLSVVPSRHQSFTTCKFSVHCTSSLTRLVIKYTMSATRMTLYLGSVKVFITFRRYCIHHESSRVITSQSSRGVTWHSLLLIPGHSSRHSSRHCVLVE